MCIYVCYIYILKVILQKYLHVLIVYSRMANMSCTLSSISLSHSLSLSVCLSIYLMLRHPRQLITYISTHSRFFFSFIITKYPLKYKINTKCQKYVCLHFEIVAERNIKKALPLFLLFLFSFFCFRSVGADHTYIYMRSEDFC